MKILSPGSSQTFRTQSVKERIRVACSGEMFDWTWTAPVQTMKVFVGKDRIFVLSASYWSR